MKILKMPPFQNILLMILAVLFVCGTQASADVEKITSTQVFSNVGGGAPITLVTTITQSVSSSAAASTSTIPSYPPCQAFPSSFYPFFHCVPSATTSGSGSENTASVSVSTVIEDNNVTEWATATITLPPTTVTLTISQVQNTLSTTMMGFCVDGPNAVAEPCGHILPVPVASQPTSPPQATSTKKSAAVRGASNPFTVVKALKCSAKDTIVGKLKMLNPFMYQSAEQTPPMITETIAKRAMQMGPAPTTPANLNDTFSIGSSDSDTDGDSTEAKTCYCNISYPDMCKKIPQLSSPIALPFITYIFGLAIFILWKPNNAVGNARAAAIFVIVMPIVWVCIIEMEYQLHLKAWYKICKSAQLGGGVAGGMKLSYQGLFKGYVVQ